MKKNIEVDGYQQLFGSDSDRFGVNSPFNFPKCSNFPQSINYCVRLVALLFDYVEHIWILLKSNLLSNSIPVLHLVGRGQFSSNLNAWIKRECIFKLTVLPNTFKTFQRYGNYDYVIAFGQRDCLIYHWYNWPQREPSLLCDFWSL